MGHIGSAAVPAIATAEAFEPVAQALPALTTTAIAALFHDGSGSRTPAVGVVLQVSWVVQLLLLLHHSQVRVGRVGKVIGQDIGQGVSGIVR